MEEAGEGAGLVTTVAVPGPATPAKGATPNGAAGADGAADDVEGAAEGGDAADAAPTWCCCSKASTAMALGDRLLMRISSICITRSSERLRCSSAWDACIAGLCTCCMTENRSCRARCRYAMVRPVARPANRAVFSTSPLPVRRRGRGVETGGEGGVEELDTVEMLKREGHLDTQGDGLCGKTNADHFSYAT